MSDLLNNICELIASGEIPPDVYNKYLDDNFATAQKAKECVLDSLWHNAEDELPKENGRYLCEYPLYAIGVTYYNVYWYAKDLYDVDDVYFADKRGEGGFYMSDSEWGHYEISDVIRWREIV